MKPNDQNNTNHTPPAPQPLPSQFANTVLAPVEPWPSPVEGHVLLDAILRELTRFVVFPKWAAELFALFIVHTFAFHLRSICTYIAVESPEKECGKSTLLTLLSHFVNRPVISSNVSSPAFYRAIAELGPTFLIDEGDTNLRGRQELRGILNAGYSKPNAFVLRMSYDPIPLAAPEQSEGGAAPHVNNGSSAESPNPNSKFKNQNPSGSSGHLACFTSWCPKVIASIGRIHDTLASRCIVIRMHRKTEGEECERLKFLNATDLKRQCARFVLDHAAAIAAADPAIPAGLTNRAADIWEPLFAIADLAGGRWPELARQAAVALTATAQDRSPIGALLLDIFVIFIDNKVERLFSRDLAAALNQFTDRPWAELRKGKAIDELWLSKQLRPYGIRPRSIRLGDQTAKGYVLEDFKDTFKRYIPNSEIEALKKELAERTAPAPENEKPCSSRPDEPPSTSPNAEAAAQPPEIAQPPLSAAPVAVRQDIQNQNSKIQNPETDSSTSCRSRREEASAIENQKSKIEIPAETCLQCGEPLPPAPLDAPRSYTHCPSCGTPVGVPPGTSLREKCPHCATLQPLHGYNAFRDFNTCPECKNKLPALDPKSPTPWLPPAVP